MLKLVLEEKQSVHKVAKDLGISDKTIYNWVAKSQKQIKSGGKPEEAFPGRGNRKKEDEKIRQLESENRLLRMERDLLKKTMGFFVERPT